MRNFRAKQAILAVAFKAKAVYNILKVNLRVTLYCKIFAVLNLIKPKFWKYILQKYGSIKWNFY